MKGKRKKVKKVQGVGWPGESERVREERKEERELRKAREGGWMDRCGARVKVLYSSYGQMRPTTDEKVRPPRK